MKPVKAISSCQHILIDTSFIIDVLSDPDRYKKDVVTQERIELAHKVFEELSLPRPKELKCMFYISAVTIGELRKNIADNIAKDLVTLFHTGDITFIDYTKDIALLLNRSLEEALPDGQKYQLIRYHEELLRKGGFVNARQWVSDDLKIIASAKAIKGLDVILTSDRRTFKALADKLGVPCLSMFKEDLSFDLFGNLER